MPTKLQTFQGFSNMLNMLNVIGVFVITELDLIFSNSVELSRISELPIQKHGKQQLYFTT